jgi:4-hydroxy-tetrahydrodipicolinate reductase
MVKLAICGAGGRMGQAILAAASKNKNAQVTGLVEKAGCPMVGTTVNGVKVSQDLAAAAGQADVVIDFTSAEAALKNADVMARASKAYVVGTTGLAGPAREQFVAKVKKIPVVLSPNMSLSANVLFQFAEDLARLLPTYDAEVVEIHHNLKMDSPSGTAQRLAEAIAAGRGQGDPGRFVYGRHGLAGERQPAEVGVHAVRGGDVVGDHTVFFLGAGERIELVHRVTSREAFAQGALIAALWVARQKPGLYDMRDVLGLRK